MSFTLYFDKALHRHGNNSLSSKLRCFPTYSTYFHPKRVYHHVHLRERDRGGRVTKRK